MERRAQHEIASVPRIYRREPSPEVREYLVLTVALGGAASGKYVGIRTREAGAVPEIASYDVAGRVAGDAMRLRRPGGSELIVETDGWRRVSREEVDDDVVRFAERGASALAVAAPSRSPDAEAREATEARRLAEHRVAEARATAEILEDELRRARDEHAQALARAGAAEHRLAEALEREAEALAAVEAAARQRAAAEEEAARMAAARLARERDAYVRARVAARLAAAPLDEAPAPVDDGRERELEARFAEASAAATRARAALEEHRARWSSRFGRTPQSLIMASKAAERELDAARDELTLFRREQRQRRLEELRAEREAAAPGSPEGG